MGKIIKPFKATHYNTKLFNEYSDVICPPYDVISSEQLKKLRKKSSYNFSHILLADKGRYEQKRKELDKWIEEGVLVSDDADSMYLYEQKYKVKGKLVTRYGIVALLKMDKKGIFPHEKTHKAPKEDRKKIIQAVEANLSPIFVIAGKHLSKLAALHKKYSKRKPFIKCKDHDGNDNRLWQINEKREINSLTKAFSKAPLLIADGHHRFEISYDYFKKYKNKYKDLNYVLAYITDFQKGLTILPTHRIMSVNESTSGIISKLQKHFDIKQISQKDIDKALARAKKFCMGICCQEKFYFLKLKNEDFLDKIPNKLFRPLDAYVFHKLILPLLKVEKGIEYSHSVAESKVLAGKDKTAFLLRAADLKSVVAISSAGYRLPQKSTYFYPKLLSGLLIRRFSK
jgi:uncharacterized protein (DUF1015 family)